MSEENIFKDDEQGSLTGEPLEELNKLISELHMIERDIADLKLTMEVKSKRLVKISGELIPAILQSAGLLGLKLFDGREVAVNHKLHATITEENLNIAYENMVMCEGGDEEARKKVDSLFKSNVFLGKTPSAVTEQVENILKDYGVDYEIKRTIHYQTLGKYCRERLSQGKNIPDGISSYAYKETKIK